MLSAIISHKMIALNLCIIACRRKFEDDESQDMVFPMTRVNNWR